MIKAEATLAGVACCAPQPTVKQLGQTGTPMPASRRPIDHALIALEAGTFLMGAADGPHPQDGEGPVRQVTVDAFEIASLVVTNAEFLRFVNETGYKTIAERSGTSFVFEMFVPEAENAQVRSLQTPWWCEVSGACWHLPEGPVGPDLSDRMDHPVVHIALPDALAYCDWAGVCLPSEAQWEYAARGGLEAQPFPWGGALELNGTHHSNVWQGTFPDLNTAEDGFTGTAPAQCYSPNGYGLYAMTGNVWEWTADRFTLLHSPRPTRNPCGPLNGARFVAKGGSYLCHASYCQRYRTSSRQALDPLTTADNLGFRIARSEGPHKGAHLLPNR